METEPEDTDAVTETEAETTPEVTQSTETESTETESTETESTETESTETKPTETEPTETKPTAPSTIQIPQSGLFSDSIAYARSIANGVQAYYTGSYRSAYTVENQNMAITHELKGTSRQISSLVNSKGIPYLTETMSAYLEVDGIRFYSKNSTAPGAMNMYRYGTYYYETHIQNLNFGNSVMADPDVEAIDLLAQNRTYTGNDTVARKGSDGILSINVRSANDPYVKFASTPTLSVKEYDAVLITMRAEYATNGVFYVSAGSKTSVNGEQYVNFGIVPGDEFHTYVVPLNTVKDFIGKFTVHRIDVGAKAGETIEIKELKIIKAISAEVPAISMERILHTYPDKMNTAIHFVATGAVKGMDAYGMETAIAASSVQSLLVLDKNGEHTTLTDVDWSSVTAVAFDVKDAGVFGYILTTAEGVGTLTVTEQDGFYLIDQQAKAKQMYKEFDEFYLSQRIYTDETHSFDGFRQAVYEEYHPLTLTVTSKKYGAKFIGYDAMRGSYRMELKGGGFNDAYYTWPDLHYSISASVTGDDADRNVYLYTESNGGSLESAVLLDAEGRVLPYMMQVSKNFQGENEEPVFDRGDTGYGEAFFPLQVKSGETLSFTVLNLYQNWGIFPLKQISSIQFHAPYYHLSTGVTETNCIAPYYVYGSDKWTLPDFRSMSAPLWDNQPQHTSGGRLYFLQYTDAKNQYNGAEMTGDEVISHGPVYADIWMDYLSDDGRIEIEYRHLEMPQTDENRTYYEIHMKVLEDVSIKKFRDNFTIFSMDGRDKVFNTFAYLNENNEPTVTATTKKTRPVYYSLGKESPFVSYSHITNNDNYINLAAIIKDWDITIGGEPYTGGFVASEVFGSGVNTVRLTLDLDDVTLKAGDEIHINMILLPWGSQLTAKDDISNVLNVRKDTCLEPIRAEVTIGTLYADPYMPQIKADNGTAEFTLTGGENHMAVRVYGYDSYEKPTMEEYVNGAWVPYNTASGNGYDGYSVLYDGDGTYSFAFIVDMTGDVSRTFRVVQ